MNDSKLNHRRRAPLVIEGSRQVLSGLLNERVDLAVPVVRRLAAISHNASYILQETLRVAVHRNRVKFPEKLPIRFANVRCCVHYI